LRTDQYKASSKAFLPERLIEELKSKEETPERLQHQLKEVQNGMESLQSMCKPTLIYTEKLTPTVYSGKAMTTNLVFSRNAGFVLHFLVEPPKLSAVNNFFTTESLWGIREGVLTDADLEAWHKWFEALQHEQIPSQYMGIEMCTTETIRRMYETGKFEEGWNTSGARVLVFNTMTRLKEILGETRVLTERDISQANIFQEIHPVKCVQRLLLSSHSPADWRTGPGIRVEWVFKDTSYLNFADKRIDQWSYNEHVACNDALDRGWIKAAQRVK
jgi:hypothetical protein